MIYHLTIKYADGSTAHRTAIGALGPICDALYDDDALGITAILQP